MESTLQRKLLGIRNRLEGLGCPFLEDGSEQWLAELIFHPSEGRTKLLTWVVLKFDSKFDEILSEPTPNIIGRIDSRHQKLLVVLNILGVVKNDEIELASGKASQKKQIAFWFELVDIVYTAVIGLYSDSDSSHDAFDTTLLPAHHSNVRESFNDSCKFVDTLLRENKMKDIFSTDIHLLPPDIERIVRNDAKHREIPNLQQLQDTANSMTAELTEQLNQRDEASVGSCEKLSEDVPDQSTVDNYCRMIDLKMKTLSQILDSFGHCYDNDMETYCKTNSPKLSDIGSSVNLVSNRSQDILNLLESLKLLSRSSSYLSNHLRKEVEPENKLPNIVDSRSTHTPDTSSSYVDDRDACTILQNAISRRQLAKQK